MEKVFQVAARTVMTVTVTGAAILRAEDVAAHLGVDRKSKKLGFSQRDREAHAEGRVEASNNC